MHNKTNSEILIMLGTSVLVLIVSLSWFEIYVILANSVKIFSTPVFNRILTAILISIIGIAFLFYFRTSKSYFKEGHGDEGIDGRLSEVTVEGAGAGGVQLLGQPTQMMI